MNRAQRRKALQNGHYSGTQEPRTVISCLQRKDSHPDFSEVPLATVCQSIWLLISELHNRGYPVYDFDHKEKTVQGIKIIRDKVYFLAAEEVGNEEGGMQTYR